MIWRWLTPAHLSHHTAAMSAAARGADVEILQKARRRGIRMSHRGKRRTRPPEKAAKGPAPIRAQGLHSGGDGEIRTLDTLLRYTRFPIVRARPATRHLRIAIPAGGHPYCEMYYTNLPPQSQEKNLFFERFLRFSHTGAATFLPLHPGSGGFPLAAGRAFRYNRDEIRLMRRLR